MKYRLAGFEDWPAVTEVLASTGYYQPVDAALLDGPVIVAENEDGIQGCIWAITTGRHAYVDLLGVRPKFQGSRVGVKLMKHMRDFLKEQGNQLKSEFYIPTAVDTLIQQGSISAKVLPTNEKWFGVTYKEDMKRARNSVKKLIKQEIYPEKLWQL